MHQADIPLKQICLVRKLHLQGGSLVRFWRCWGVSASADQQHALDWPIEQALEVWQRHIQQEVLPERSRTAQSERYCLCSRSFVAFEGLETKKEGSRLEKPQEFPPVQDFEDLSASCLISYAEVGLW